MERFNITLLMMLAMFAGKNRDDCDHLFPAVMMAYRSSVHESTGFSPYRLMFAEECTLPMDVGIPRQEPDMPDPITSPYAAWFMMPWRWRMIRSADIKDSLYNVRKDVMIEELPDGCSRWGIGFCGITAKKCKLDSAWTGPYLVVSLAGWALGIQRHPDSPIILVHCQDLKKIPRPSGLVSWMDAARSRAYP